MKITLPIKAVFELFGAENQEYKTPLSIGKGIVHIDSPQGMVPVLALVRKNAESCRYFFSDGNSMVTAKHHVVFNTDSNPVKIDDAGAILSRHGIVDIVNNEYIGKIDVFDVALDAPHQYYTNNGILHHNTTLAKVLLHELDVDWGDVLEINASSNNGVDYIRDTITNFTSSMPFGEFKYVLLDECLEENTLVITKRNGKEIAVPIKDLDDNNDLVKSYNVKLARIEWKSFILFNKGVQETLEIEFDNGEVVICTPDHKWYVDDNGPKVVKASELSNYDHVLFT